MSSVHSAECMFRPVKLSSPLKWAGAGSLSWPIALTSTVDSNVSSPSPVFSVEIQRRLLSSQRDDVNSVLRRTMLADVVFPRDLQEIVVQFLRCAK